MTRDDVIAMGRTAGVFTADGMCVTVTIDIAERFAALVAAKATAEVEQKESLMWAAALVDGVRAEREACAQIVAAPHWKTVVRQALAKRAAEIRARGEK